MQGAGPRGPPGTAPGLPRPQTQPVPNPVAYFLHRSPWWFHRFETLSNHFLELVVPFFIFLGRRMCIVHGALQVLVQVSSRAHREPELPHPVCRTCGGGPAGPPSPREPCPHLPAPRHGAHVELPQTWAPWCQRGRDPTPGGSLRLGWLFTMPASTKFSCFLFTRNFVFFVLGIFSHEWVRFSKNAATVSYLPRMNQTQSCCVHANTLLGTLATVLSGFFALSVRFFSGFPSTLAVSGSALGLTLTLADKTELLLRHLHSAGAGGGGRSGVCVATDNLSWLLNIKGLCFL